MSESNPVISGYSDLAAAYDSSANLQSCWGISTDRVVAAISVPESSRCVLDVGCGTGHALLAIAENAPTEVNFVGVEPAAEMRARAAHRTRHLANVKVMDGTFEDISLPSGSVDYLYSIYAFHWTTDPVRAAEEIHRLLGTDAEMDLIFVGPDNGVEFNRVTTPIMQRYMGRGYMLAAARMQKQISKDRAVELFQLRFPHRRLTVEESHETFYDSIEGHWGWRVRIEGHFSRIPVEKRSDFDADVRHALEGLTTDRGIPYTIHQLHVKLRR